VLFLTKHDPPLSMQAVELARLARHSGELFETILLSVCLLSICTEEVVSIVNCSEVGLTLDSRRCRDPHCDAGGLRQARGGNESEIVKPERGDEPFQNAGERDVEMPNKWSIEQHYVARRMFFSRQATACRTH